MIIEMRTCTLKPGSIAEAEKRFGAALPVREKHSNLAAFWHTEIGLSNQIIHVWVYKDFEHRAAVRYDTMEDEDWPPPIHEFVVHQESEVFLPAPFSPPLEPREVGPIFEMRQYTLKAGAIPGMIERWSEKIEDRQKYSPLVGAWYTQFGSLNKWCHIWAYKDANQRFSVRDSARAAGAWPPGSPPGTMVSQVNAILMPAAFSPIR